MREGLLLQILLDEYCRRFATYNLHSARCICWPLRHRSCMARQMQDASDTKSGIFALLVGPGLQPGLCFSARDAASDMKRT